MITSRFKSNLIFFILLMAGSWSFALAPAKDFVTFKDLGPMQTYRSASQNLEIAEMPSELTFEDLTADLEKKLSGLVSAKKEYGKAFGFNAWAMTSHRYVEDATQRRLLVLGTYRDRSAHLVHFMEVYWADHRSAKQFLLTSEKRALTFADFSGAFQQ